MLKIGIIIILNIVSFTYIFRLIYVVNKISKIKRDLYEKANQELRNINYSEKLTNKEKIYLLSAFDFNLLFFDSKKLNASDFIFSYKINFEEVKEKVFKYLNNRITVRKVIEDGDIKTCLEKLIRT